MSWKPGSEIPVRFLIFPTAWGEAALAWSRKGVIRFILPGLSRKEMLAELEKDFSALAAGNSKELGDLVSAVQDYYREKPVRFVAELDLTWAGPFSRKVYRALMKIPYGQTATYREIAAAAGSPGACRAAGSAAAANRIPLIIPCHRLVRSDGSLGGFSAAGGVSTKRKMLEMEARAAARLKTGSGRMPGSSRP